MDLLDIIILMITRYNNNFPNTYIYFFAELNKMDTNYCLELSGIVSTSLLLTAISSVGITRSEGSSDIPTTTLQNSPKMLIQFNQQQNPSNSLVDKSSTSTLHPAEALADPGKPWTIKTKYKRTSNRAVGFELQRSSTFGYTEALRNEMTETVLSSGYVDPARHKRETLHVEAEAETQRDSQIITNAITSPSESSTNGMDPFTPANDPSSMSSFGNMYLCDHPPKTFSPSYYGSSCLQYDNIRIMSFRNTKIICNSIYSLTESNPEPLMIGTYPSNFGPLEVITHQKYVKVCLPIFRRFNKCEERNFLTICWEDRIVFFHSSACTHFANHIFIAVSLLDNNTECFHEFCEGRQNVVDAEVGGLIYRLTNTKHSVNAPSCGYLAMNLNHVYRKYNGTLNVLINDHWPCCYHLYMVIWAGLPEDHGLNGAWSYLPAACQAGEVLLLVFVGCVMVGSIGGNLLVLVVMLRGGHRGQESSLLRTSLAFADLLTATFVIVPSFVYHLSPFLFSPTYMRVAPDMMLTSDPFNATSKIRVSKGIIRQSGFTVFQSILFYMTSTVSLLMLLVLSVERFVITGRYLRYRDYFSYCRTVLAIVFSWTTSFVTALWFASHDNGGLASQWLLFEKLPSGASGYGPGGVRNIIYHGQFVLFFMLGMSVVIFSVLAMRNFVKEQVHVAKEWKSFKMKASKQYSQDNRYVLTTMTFMLVFFLASTLPLAANIVSISIWYNLQLHPIFPYFAWWLFMAGSAWNPWLYNFRSRQFKEDLTTFKCQAWQRQCFRAEESQSLPDNSLPTGSTWLATESKTK